MYIVTSKPKRISVYSGFVHMIYILIKSVSGGVCEADKRIVLILELNKQRKTRKSHS